MAELWNLWNLTPPPTCSVKGVLNHKEVRDLCDTMFQVLQTLRNIKDLDREAALLSRMVYKYKRQFRHDKAMQSFIKINQCLKRYLKLNFFDVADNFKQALPGKLQEKATHVYLPTRQMLQWLLLRLQAFAQIFLRIVQICNEAGPQIYAKLCLGWALKLTFFMYGITARILAVAKYLVAKSIEWYGFLHGYLPKLQQTADFLPDHVFPADLKKWLGDVDVSPPRTKKSSIDEVFEIIDLAVVDGGVSGGSGGGGDDEDDVVLLQENFIRSIFKSRRSVEITIDSDVEEVADSDVEEVEPETKPEVRKRPAPSEAIDVGVPIGKKSKKNGNFFKGRDDNRKKMHGNNKRKFK